jgi:hypothetical protein
MIKIRKMSLKNTVYYAILMVLFFACNTAPNGVINQVGRQAQIKPDYTGLTIPQNIAPMNFAITEPGESFYVRISAEKGKSIEINSGSGIIDIPQSVWAKLLEENAGGKLDISISVKNDGKWNQFRNISNTISTQKIDPYLFYRLLLPGYESWSEISIKQRNLENFEESSLIENSLVDQNCVNCHSFSQGKSTKFMFHMRGSMGGTYFVTKNGLQKFNLKTKEMANGAIYPRWHPSGKFLAFSSNNIVQQFHSSELKKIEVTDLASTIVLYDMETNEMMDVELENNHQYMDTYPEWSPNGKFIYFSRAVQVAKVFDYRDIKYDIYRAAFNPETRKFGSPEKIFDASSLGKSASFARISPDGKSMVFTLHTYGSFPIWHKDADLYLINLETLATRPLKSNSDFADSYHSWSQNSRWLVFSSKRDDGLTARPYIAYFDENGNEQKPFILPQKDPNFYDHFLKTYNIPEFADSKIELNPGEIRRVAEKPAIQAKWAKN